MRALPQSVQDAIARSKGHKPKPEKAPIRIPRSKQNKLEAAYDFELNVRKLAGDIRWYGFQAVKLRLADGAWYTPDFFVVRADGSLEAHETKGHMREAAAVRLKVAREQHPWLTIILVKAQSQRGGGFDSWPLT